MILYLPVESGHLGSGGAQPVLSEAASNSPAAQHADRVRHAVEQLQEAAQVPKGPEGCRRDHQVQPVIGLEAQVLDVAVVAVSHGEWPTFHHRLCTGPKVLHALCQAVVLTHLRSCMLCSRLLQTCDVSEKLQRHPCEISGWALTNRIYSAVEESDF